MQRAIIFIVVGFVLAYVIQEIRMRKQAEKKQADALASIGRVKNRIIADIKGAVGDNRAKKIVNQAMDKESSFCGC